MMRVRDPKCLLLVATATAAGCPLPLHLALALYPIMLFLLCRWRHTDEVNDIYYIISVIHVAAVTLVSTNVLYEHQHVY